MGGAETIFAGIIEREKGKDNGLWIASPKVITAIAMVSS